MSRAAGRRSKIWPTDSTQLEVLSLREHRACAHVIRLLLSPLDGQLLLQVVDHLLLLLHNL